MLRQSVLTTRKYEMNDSQTALPYAQQRHSSISAHSSRASSSFIFQSIGHRSMESITATLKYAVAHCTNTTYCSCKSCLLIWRNGSMSLKLSKTLEIASICTDSLTSVASFIQTRVFKSLTTLCATSSASFVSLDKSPSSCTKLP